jgi:hypothetical protein
MKKLVLLVKEHLANDFNGFIYVGHALWLMALISINYSWGIEARISQSHPSLRIPLFFLFNMLAYGVSLGIIGWKRPIRVNQELLIMTGMGVLILAMDRGFPFISTIALKISNDIPTYRWVFGLITSGVSFALVLLPVLLMAQLPSQRAANLYGLGPSKISFYSYLQLLMFVAPLIMAASTLPSFRSYYPVYQYYSLQTDHATTALGAAWIYELMYGLDFINVEVLFRGFFVIGLAKYLGKESILPMVTIYCCLHFGKPLGEAVSSIVGGYIIGVIAYQTRSVWGGILVHIGIAWMMEAGAYLARKIVFYYF